MKLVSNIYVVSDELDMLTVKRQLKFMEYGREDNDEIIPDKFSQFNPGCDARRGRGSPCRERSYHRNRQQ
jgi:hypothetical protein